MLRFVRKPQGVYIDVSNAAQGRGAYICLDPKCAESVFDRGILAKTLKVSIDPGRVAMLRQQTLEYLLMGK